MTGGHSLYTTVDSSKCCGYTRCAEICPEVYKLDEDGLSYVEDDVVPPGLEEKAREAANACPVEAIYIGPTPQGS